MRWPWKKEKTKRRRRVQIRKVATIREPTPLEETVALVAPLAKRRTAVDDAVAASKEAKRKLRETELRQSVIAICDDAASSMSDLAKVLRRL
jgi:hypothetical protein